MITFSCENINGTASEISVEIETVWNELVTLYDSREFVNRYYLLIKNDKVVLSDEEDGNDKLCEFLGYALFTYVPPDEEIIEGYTYVGDCGGMCY